METKIWKGEFKEFIEWWLGQEDGEPFDEVTLDCLKDLAENEIYILFKEGDDSWGEEDAYRPEELIKLYDENPTVKIEQYEYTNDIEFHVYNNTTGEYIGYSNGMAHIGEYPY